ncbi:MAG: GNAT family N-acetyltransferase [Candidatus Sumerlaeia bacterium]
MTISIRPADASDREPLAEIIRASFADVAEIFGITPENCPSNPAFATAESIDRMTARGSLFYILEEDGKACGCVALERPSPGVAWLERLAVLPACRRRGHGRMLIEHGVAEARRAGAARVELALIARHEHLRRWYERLGFTATETKSFPHLPFDVLFMAKTLE